MLKWVVVGVATGLSAVCLWDELSAQEEACPDRGITAVGEAEHQEGHPLACQNKQGDQWICKERAMITPAHAECQAPGSSPGFKCVPAGTMTRQKCFLACGEVKGQCRRAVCENTGKIQNFDVEECKKKEEK